MKDKYISFLLFLLFNSLAIFAINLEGNTAGYTSNGEVFLGESISINSTSNQSGRETLNSLDSEEMVLGDGVHYELFSDIEYGNGLKLDLYKSSESNAPIFMYVHPGGWSSGDKLDNSDIILDYLARNGFDVISINYHLASSDFVGYPIQLEDIDCALRWIYASKDIYGFNIDEFYLGGGSAGGHLTLLYTLNQGDYKNGICVHPHQRPEIKKEVSIVGPTDITIPTEQLVRGEEGNSWREWFTGYEYDYINLPVYRDASPRFHLDNINEIEYLLMYSEDDEVVGFENHFNPFYNLMSDRGFDVQAYTVETGGHGFFGINEQPILLNFLNGLAVDNRRENNNQLPCSLESIDWEVANVSYFDGDSTNYIINSNNCVGENLEVNLYDKDLLSFDDLIVTMNVEIVEDVQRGSTIVRFTDSSGSDLDFIGIPNLYLEISNPNYVLSSQIEVLGRDSEINVIYGEAKSLLGSVGSTRSSISECPSNYIPTSCEWNNVDSEVFSNSFWYNNIEIVGGTSINYSKVWCELVDGIGYRLNSINNVGSNFNIRSVCTKNSAIKYSSTKTLLAESNSVKIGQSSICPSGFSPISCEWKGSLENNWNSNLEFMGGFGQPNSIGFCELIGNGYRLNMNNFNTEYKYRTTCLNNSMYATGSIVLASGEIGTTTHSQISSCPSGFSPISCEWRTSSEDTWKSFVENIGGQTTELSAIACELMPGSDGYRLKFVNSPSNIILRSICIKE